MKRVGARTQPCFPPFVTGNESEVSPLSRTVALIPSCNWRTSAVNVLWQPNVFIICHSPSLQTVSNALAFLLPLAGNEDHVNGPTATAEVALALWK